MFGKSWVGVTAEEISAHGDEDHGVRDVDASLVVAHEASPAHHPSESALHDPASGQDLEALLAVRSADDRDEEVEIGSLVHEFEPVISRVGEQVLDPGPTGANGVEDCLGAS